MKSYHDLPMKSFTRKPITNQSNSPITPSQWNIVKQFATVIGILLLCVLGWGVLWHGLTWVRVGIADFLKSSVWVIGSTMGEDVDQDEMWQISVLIMGIGGEWHRGSYNTDTMMVASYNPKHKAVSFISVPRDLYINLGTGNGAWRINNYLNEQLNNNVELKDGLASLADKVGSIMGISIDHYVLVDFQWFEDMIDTLGGIEVDVPKKIVDPTYPADEFAVMTLVIESGLQMMDGDTALKYARSRHSTSDFDRSLRQQQIIQWIVKQVLGGGWILKLKQLKTDFDTAVTTDFDFSQLLWLSKYLNKIDHYFSFVLQSDCEEYYTLMKPGCLLYSPAREDFGGAAVLLPEWAKAWRLSYYNNIQQFAYYTIHQQPFLIEKARIVLWNGIDKSQLLPWQNMNGVIGDVASELVKYGFNVVWIGNNNIKNTTSSVIKVGTGEYDVTADLLRDFAPVVYDQSTAVSSLSGTLFSGSNEIDMNYSGADLIMVIGNDYLSNIRK
jgi:LCP family protein required for cell wall assembly